MAHARIDLADPASFRHWVDEVLRFGDQDAGGHINNVSVARYVESGRVLFMRHAGMPPFGADERVVIARVAIDYLKESHWPAAARVGTAVIRIGTKSFTLGSGVFVAGDCIATAESVAVFMRNGQSAALPEAGRAWLEVQNPA